MDNILYDYLQSLLPNNLQFVDPYIDNAPIPQGDWCCMNVLNTQTIGRSAERQGEVNIRMQAVNIFYDIQKIYKVQFDFYGINSFNNAEIYLQTLQVELDKNTKQGNSNYNLKEVSEVRNLTEFLENKKYYKRYSFDVSLYCIETIQKTNHYLTNYKIDKVVICNN